MKKYLFASFFLLSYALCSNAQSDTSILKIKGIVQENFSEIKIENSTIQVFSISKIKYALSDKDGIFKINENRVPDSIKISSAGFETVLLTKFVVKENILDLETIYLDKHSTLLKTVQVKSEKKSIIFELNKITYNVQSDPDNIGLTGIEVLQKVPLVDVSSNNKIFVNGKGNFIVLLNGRNSGIVGSDPSAFLKSIQSSLISKIEINTNPPAKYRLEGYEYIINIIITKKIIDGIFSSINGSSDSFGGYDLGYFLMVKAGKLRFTNNSTYSHLQGATSEYYFINKNKLTKYENIQAGSLRNKSNTFISGLDVTYEIDTLKLFSLSCYTSNVILNSFSLLNNSYFKNNMPYNNSIRNLNNKDKSGFVYLSADYELLSKNKLNTLTFSTKWYNNYSNVNTNFIDKNIIVNNSDTNENLIKGNGNEYTFQVDYLKNLNGKGNINLGFKEILRIYSTINKYNKLQIAVNDYTQNIQSIYLAYTKNNTKNSITIGSGINLTEIKNTEQITSNRFSKQYFNVLPFLNFAHQLKKDRSISFDYILSVKRPSLNYINTGKNYSNPENLQTGNPNLTPELFNELKTTYNTSLWKRPLIIGFYLKHSTNSITENITPYQDSLTLRSYINGGKYLNFGSTLYYYKKFFKKLSVKLTTDLGYISQENKNLNLKNEGIIYKIILSLSYKLPYKFTLSSQNFIYSKTLSIQGYSQNFNDLRISLSKKLVNEKLNISLTLYQPYNKKIKLETAYSDLEFSNYSYTNFPSRYLNFSLSYELGDISKVFGGRQKTKGISNDDLKEK